MQFTTTISFGFRELKRIEENGQIDKKKNQENPKIPVISDNKNACRKELKHQPHDSSNFQRSVSSYKFLFNDTKDSD